MNINIYIYIYIYIGLWNSARFPTNCETAHIPLVTY